jgi:hypothetical protein
MWETKSPRKPNGFAWSARSLLHLWIFCMFMQKIPINGLLWEFVRRNHDHKTDGP